MNFFLLCWRSCAICFARVVSVVVVVGVVGVGSVGGNGDRDCRCRFRALFSRRIRRRRVILCSRVRLGRFGEGEIVVVGGVVFDVVVVEVELLIVVAVVVVVVVAFVVVVGVVGGWVGVGCVGGGLGQRE